jgi:sulfotransferase family protein
MRPGKRRVVDKLPGNHALLGLIQGALPQARIIHTRRSPIDSCLSAYATNNFTSVEYGHDRANMVFAYRQYQRLSAHWREILPADRYLEVEYESLVFDPESTTRRMVEFCGLEWDDACLRPQDNAHVVFTPSSWQVRQPIYKSSVGRWKRFEPWLGEFKELLDEP